MVSTPAPATPDEYIERLEEPRRGQIRRLHELIRENAPSLDPYLQAGMLAYGPYHYRYESGREGDWFRIGLASQKRYISLYLTADKDGRYVAEAYRDRLPKADIGKSCVRLKSLDDAHEDQLAALIREAAAWQPG